VSGQGSEVEIRLDGESLRKIQAMAKAAEPTLRREVNKTLRGAGDVAAQAARDAVLGALPPKAENRSKVARFLNRAATPAAATGNGSLRAAIAAGVRVTVRSGKSAGVRVLSTDAKLPDSKKAMNRVYRLQVFRHPVFAEDRWVNQHGKDWFYTPVKSKKPEFEAAVLAAMQNAAETLGNA
jgi:hypothetical protein